MCIIITSCNINKIDLKLFEKPINSTKSIETRYYNPIYLNNKWIPGEEINNIFIYPRIEYFDEFNNILLKKDLRDSINQKYSNFYIRTFYFDPSTGKKSKQIILRASNPKDYKIKSFERDSLGRLLSVNSMEKGQHVPDWDDNTPESINYDSEGNTIAKQNGLTIITKKIYSDKDIIVYMKQTIKENCNEYYKDIQGLETYELITTDAKTSNPIMILTENIIYETLNSKKMIIYKYDKIGNIIEEEIFKIENSHVLRSPDLIGEELDKYLKDHYFGTNIKYSSHYIKIERKYDNNNNLIYNNYIDNPNIHAKYFPSEFNIENYENFIAKAIYKKNESSKTYYEYEYNHKNDWIKRTKYEEIQLSPFEQALNNLTTPYTKKVSEIIIRKIEYFN